MRLVKLTRCQWMGTGNPPVSSDVYLNPEHVVSVEPHTQGPGTRIGTVNGSWGVSETLEAVVNLLVAK